MNLIRPYHFAQFRAEGFLPYYQAIARAGGVLCFDLADSRRGANGAAIGALKQAERRNVQQLLHTLQPQLDLGRLALRLNAPSTPHFAEDLALLHTLPGLHAVLVPKLEQPQALQQVLEQLPATVQHVIPVLETATALAFLPTLLSVSDARLRLVAFGHGGGNPSQGHFQCHHSESETYWDWIAQLDAHLSAAGKQLLNAPMPQLDNAPQFRAMLQRLRSFPSAAGQITLCLAQTLLCAEPVVSRTGTPALLPVPGPDNAHQLVRTFEQGQRPGRFFTFDKGRSVISPQEYVAALLRSKL